VTFCDPFCCLRDVPAACRLTVGCAPRAARRYSPSTMPQPAWVAGRLQKESAVSRFFYNTILKRSSTYMTAVMIMATATGIGYDYAMNAIWDFKNKGKLWKDIKMNYKEE